MAKRCTMQAVIHPGDESGHMAECIDLAVVTQGRTLDETVQNLREALQLHLEGEDLIEGRRSSVPPSDQAGDGHRIGKAKPRCADGNVEQCVGAGRSQKAGVKHALPGDHRGRPLDLRSPRSRSSRLHRRRGETREEVLALVAAQGWCTRRSRRFNPAPEPEPEPRRSVLRADRGSGRRASRPWRRRVAPRRR